MLRSTLLLLALALSSNSWSQELTLEEGINLLSQINALTEAPISCEPSEGGVTLPPLTPSFSERGADCSKFIQTDGTYGPWGQHIQEYFNQEKGDDFRLLAHDLPGMAEICPRWEGFSKETKVHFWVWSLASLANTESTCKEKVRNSKATDGVAVGLLQMNEKRSDRYWRGPSCGVADVSQARENLHCGLDIFNEVAKAKEGLHKGTGHLYGRRNGSYWEHLRRADGGEVGRRIREFPLCH